jgi:REP element-mobilizing transposase RayT
MTKPAASYNHPMTSLQPIYTGENTRVAYQLNWSVSLFARDALPDKSEWFTALAEQTEPDGVRLLECRAAKPQVVQFLASTAPSVAPSNALRSIKGRLQHLLRDQLPRAFRRNYRIESVGEVHNRVLQNYVAGQPQRHRMADGRVAARLEAVQFHDEQVDLSVARTSAHGQFLCNLHIVLENAEHLPDAREDTLVAVRRMLVAACLKRRWLLSRVGVASNHVHVLVGCDVGDAPRAVALSLLNNLAYAQGMVAAYEFSYYAGTFGNYDRDAIRRAVANQS